jgi:hypothetical protein
MSPKPSRPGPSAEPLSAGGVANDAHPDGSPSAIATRAASLNCSRAATSRSTPGTSRHRHPEISTRLAGCSGDGSAVGQLGWWPSRVRICPSVRKGVLLSVAPPSHKSARQGAVDHRARQGMKPTEITRPVRSDIDAPTAQLFFAVDETWRQLERRIATLEKTVDRLTEIPKSLIPTAKAAKYCGCAPKTLLRAVKTGELHPASYKGNRPLFAYAELDRYNATKAAKGRSSERPGDRRINANDPPHDNPRVADSFQNARRLR